MRIGAMSAAEWDACAGAGNPFVSHAFLSAVEDSGSATAAHRLAAAARGAARRRGPAWSRSRRCMRSRTATANTCSTMAGRTRWSAPAAAIIRSCRWRARSARCRARACWCAAVPKRGAGRRRWRRPAGSSACPRCTPRSAPRTDWHALRRGRLAAAPRHAVPLGERRLRRFRRFPGRAERRASAKASGASGATRRIAAWSS